MFKEECLSIEKMSNKSGKRQGCRRRIKVQAYAHNAKGFDNFIMFAHMKNYKYKDIVKSPQGVIDLTVLGEFTKISFRCTLAHF